MIYKKSVLVRYKNCQFIVLKKKINIIQIMIRFLNLEKNKNFTSFFHDNKLYVYLHGKVYKTSIRTHENTQNNRSFKFINVIIPHF